MFFFSPSLAGFYRDDVHNEMPNDVIPLSKAKYLEAISFGYVVAGDDGMPKKGDMTDD